MAVDFKDSVLWKKSLSDEEKIYKKEEKEFFRGALLSMRDRVEPLVNRIMKDMEGYTVHDITHLDALWETASLVSSGDMTLNPPEAFVFGASVLLHDSAMTIAAYPRGLTDLKLTQTWADVLALKKAQLDQAPSKKRKTKSEIESLVKIEVLRHLHADKASELASQSWQYKTQNAKENNIFYLIDNPETRGFYGETIGLIANSHWWSIDRVENELDRFLGGFTPYTSNEVDLLKIACLLRVADALHLDKRRAPPFIRALDRPEGISANHWSFQSKLAFPRLENDAVIFTAGETTKLEDAESWWCGFDAINIADRELRDVNLLLRDRHRAGLSANRVKGANDPDDLCKLIPVSGWRPVETKLRISDVPRIVESLGGASLYGDDTNAPLRELVQNSLDAIQARRKIESREDWGLIKIRLYTIKNHVWLSVEDNGSGMSQQVLTNTLLDFGASLWRSDRIAHEFPSLASKGMSAAGRYGIGFFSVFMISSEVKVFTRRYNESSQKNMLLHFREGIKSRPILSIGSKIDAPIDGGTRVEIKLLADPRKGGYIDFFSPTRPEKDAYYIYSRLGRPPHVNLRSLIEHLVPASDVSIALSEEAGLFETIITANDWLALDSNALSKRIVSEDARFHRSHMDSDPMQKIVSSSGEILGRAALIPSDSREQNGILVDHGIRVQYVPHIFGIIKGKVSNAPRNKANFSIDKNSFKIWGEKQREIITSSGLSEERKALSAEILLELGCLVGDLPIIRMGKNWFSAIEIRKKISEANRIVIYLGDIEYDDDWDDVSRSTFEGDFQIEDEIYIIPTLGRRIPLEGVEGSKFPIKSLLFKFVESIILSVWPDCIEEEQGDFMVGRAGGSEIIRSVFVYENADS